MREENEYITLNLDEDIEAEICASCIICGKSVSITICTNPTIVVCDECKAAVKQMKQFMKKGENK